MDKATKDCETVPPIRIYMPEGWMCAIDFDYEIGEACGGNKVYPSKEDLIKNRLCCAKGGDDDCYPKRVYVVDADAYDAAVRATHPAPLPTRDADGNCTVCGLLWENPAEHELPSGI